MSAALPLMVEITANCPEVVIRLDRIFIGWVDEIIVTLSIIGAQADLENLRNTP
jgi:hypothetical protein